MPVLGEQRQLLHGQLKTTQRLAQIGEGKHQRMVEVIDLQQQVLLILDQFGLAVSPAIEAVAATAVEPFAHSDPAAH